VLLVGTVGVVAALVVPAVCVEGDVVPPEVVSEAEVFVGAEEVVGMVDGRTDVLLDVLLDAVPELVAPDVDVVCANAGSSGAAIVIAITKRAARLKAALGEKSLFVRFPFGWK
jgi:hypothetical protein